MATYAGTAYAEAQPATYAAAPTAEQVPTYAPQYAPAPAYAPAYAPAPAYAYAPYSNPDEVRTVFVTGFPADVKERELNNMLRFLPGYEVGRPCKAWCGAFAAAYFKPGQRLLVAGMLTLVCLYAGLADALEESAGGYDARCHVFSDSKPCGPLHLWLLEA